jgi:hypothetical protein
LRRSVAQKVGVSNRRPKGRKGFWFKKEPESSEYKYKTFNVMIMLAIVEGSQIFETFAAFCSKALRIGFPGPTLKTEPGSPNDYPHEIAKWASILPSFIRLLHQKIRKPQQHHRAIKVG